MNRKFHSNAWTWKLLPVIFFWAVIITSANGQSTAQGFICDSVSPSASGKLIASAIQLKSCLSEIGDIDSAKRVVDILKLDAIRFFDLGKLYDTEAKVNDYKQTKAYKDQLAQ